MPIFVKNGGEIIVKTDLECACHHGIILCAAVLVGVPHRAPVGWSL